MAQKSGTLSFSDEDYFDTSGSKKIHTGDIETRMYI